jgi:hypothetical protein
MIGTKLAHDEITQHVGSAVWATLIWATELGRSVAIKFLPEAFNHDHEPMPQFEHEARVPASHSVNELHSRDWRTL